MAKILTPLVINTGKAHAPQAQFQWNKLQNPDVFIREIATQAINLEGADLGRLISGVPTPFARAAMFQYAIASASTGLGTDGALLAFYQSLQDEWKGLVACLALDNQDISVQRINLVYSDGKDRGTTANLYEPTGAFGSMLFDEQKLWCDPTITAENQEAVPYLYVIKYKGRVIAGTAPACLLFTSAGYRLDSPKGLTDPKTRKFIDPLKADLGREDLLKLWLYVRHMRESLSRYGAQFSGDLHTTRLGEFLERWRDQIAARAAERGVTLNPDAIKPTFNKMGRPFDLLFNIQNTLYGRRGRFASRPSDLPGTASDDYVVVELDQLLLNPEIATVAEVVLNDPRHATQLGVHLLKVPVSGEDRFFALPLSERGLAIFQDSMNGLLNGGDDISSRLTGAYDASSGSLRVKLEVDVNGSLTSVERTYSRLEQLQGSRILCWPDFYSPNWGQYFLYSELPHNSPELRAYPLRADPRSFDLLADRQGEDFRFRRLFENGVKVDAETKGELLVEYEMGRINPGEYQYEIYLSDKPFKAVELQLRGRPMGYVLFKNPSANHPNGLRSLVERGGEATQEARVGFDFGSNNTCVSYSRPNDPKPSLLIFGNRRRFLLGVESPSDPSQAATPSEVFFFQNEPTESNKVKSMIMTHDTRRVKGYQVAPAVALAELVKSGFPVFEKNVPVEGGTDTELTVRFGEAPSVIRYNMKWSLDKVENCYKEGMLKVLWLKTYAELFERDLYPKFLVWAYPSAMNKQTVNQYKELWGRVASVNPLTNQARKATSAQYQAGGTAVWGDGNQVTDAPRALTEASAVCRHALVTNATVAAGAIFIGFDVGGSTTDILCMASKGDPGGQMQPTLIKEGSIRLAAGKLADATRRSANFQDVLRNFCLKHNQQIHGVTVPPNRLSPSTAAYYFNLLIDRLDEPGALRQLYGELATNCPELFALNAYMTGLIMFHAGQLAASVRRTQTQHQDQYMQPFNAVTVAKFGKGGRMFDWLPEGLSKDAADIYFQQCFADGYGPDAKQDIKRFEWLPTPTENVKAEVSFGLAASREVAQSDAMLADMVGEEGYSYNGTPLTELDTLQAVHLQHLGNQLQVSENFPRFTKFARQFAEFSQQYLGLGVPNIEEEVRRMSLIPYVQNLPEYQLAVRSASGFDFEAPLVILQGMCFLDTVLMPRLFQGRV